LQITIYWLQDEAYHQRIFTITMRTPGDDSQLILGLLYTESVIASINDIEGISHDADDPNLWEVKLKAEVLPKLYSLEQYQLTYSGCGLCGTTSIKSLELKNPPTLEKKQKWLSHNQIFKLPDLLKSNQEIFHQTGGVHGAALFDRNGKIIKIKEDIGRHNAVDKIIGSALKEKILLKESILIVSSRLSFEIVQKTIMAGIPILVAIGAPTDIAISTAQRFNLTLIGFATNESFNLYHGHWRLKEED